MLVPRRIPNRRRKNRDCLCGTNFNLSDGRIAASNVPQPRDAKGTQAPSNVAWDGLGMEENLFARHLERFFWKRSMLNFQKSGEC